MNARLLSQNTEGDGSEGRLFRVDVNHAGSVRTDLELAQATMWRLKGT